MMKARIKMFFHLHWAKVAIIGAVLLLVCLSIWGLSSMESFYRKMMLAQMPMQILLSAVSATVFVFMYLTFFRGGFSKLSATELKGEDIQIKWSDVIGIDEAKQEAWEVVQLIKDHSRLQKIGGKIVRGILMVGPPGCGKTYLAKAIATEAGIPFISMAASEFIEVFVGVGAARIRKLFKKARILAEGYGGCIVFIDELDAIGRQRTFNIFGGQEGNATQNQLLVEMDGLKAKTTNVVVIGATNAVEGVLDPALLRPGRFDRKVYIDRPGLEGREKLFRYYLNKVRHDANIDISLLARKCVYKSPADIENIVKESALIAMRKKEDKVSFKEISEAIERIDMGIKHKRKMTPHEKEMVAYHESGHLIVLYILHPTDDVFKASIISRRESLGAVYHQPREEIFTSSKERLLANIKVALGGYIAEKIKFGVTSNGVLSDFQQAMREAHDMVWRYGMSPDGYLGDYTVIPQEQVSEAVKKELNDQSEKIIKQAVKDVEELMLKERELLDRFAMELLQKEELEYDEIEDIFKEYGKFHQWTNQSSVEKQG